MKPQDILVAFKILILQTSNWTQAFLATELGISQSEISRSLQRLSLSALFQRQTRTIDAQKLLDFLQFGAPCVFHIKPMGAMGSSTRFSIEVQNDEHLDITLHWGWSTPEGLSSVHSYEPLWKSLPVACERDESLSDGVRLFEMTLILPEPHRLRSLQALSDWIHNCALKPRISRSNPGNSSPNGILHTETLEDPSCQAQYAVEFARCDKHIAPPTSEPLSKETVVDPTENFYARALSPFLQRAWRPIFRDVVALVAPQLPCYFSLPQAYWSGGP